MKSTCTCTSRLYFTFFETTN